MTTPGIDLRGVSGDVRFECPTCHWSVTLKPVGADLWTHDGKVKPRCRACDVELKKTVLL